MIVECWEACHLAGITIKRTTTMYRAVIDSIDQDYESR